MNFWEPVLADTLYTIALFLMLAVVLAPLSGWAPTDDTNETIDQAGNHES